MFSSTRKRLNIESKKCIEQGISLDGGLFIKDKYEDYSINKEDINLSYQELTKKIFKYYFTDFRDDELNEVINKAYSIENFNDKLYELKSFNELAFLELYHGPTFAFKDMALTVLPHLMEKAKSVDSKKTLILTATSGDTGGAALSGFRNTNSEVIVLYPTKGVSEFQEKQMQFYHNNHQHVIAVRGNFDDCQSLVKKVFTSNLELNNYELSSANSINIGRLIPQIVYYFASYYELVRNKEISYGDKINFVVPTGNFGNILACFLAKKMGLYINKIVCASNENNVLTEFFEKGIYNKNRVFKVTLAPAMDILISSNLERLLYLASNNDEIKINKLMNDLNEKGYYEIDSELKNNLKDFEAYYIDNNETIEVIKECFNKYHYLIDPHTAVAYGSYNHLKDHLEGKTVVVSTASPYKFLDAMRKAFNLKGNDREVISELTKKSGRKPNELFDKIINYQFEKTIWNKDNMLENLVNLIEEIDEKN